MTRGASLALQALHLAGASSSVREIRLVSGLATAQTKVRRTGVDVKVWL
jgi:hypothetical protein